MLVLLAFVKGTNMNSKNLKLYQRVQKSYRGIVITIVCVIVFVIFATVTNYVAFRDKLIEKEQEQLMAIAKSTSKHLEDFMNDKISDMGVLEQIVIDDYKNDEDDDTFEVLVGRSLNNYLRIQKGEVFQLQYYEKGGRLLFDTIAIDPIEKKTTRIPLLDVGVLKKKTPYVTDIYQLNSGELAIDIIDTIHDLEDEIGHLRMTIMINDLYHLKVADIKIGEKGYASVKDYRGILIMHPNDNDIGKEVMKARRAKLPEYDWSELEALVAKQMRGEAGTGIYHSYWYYDEEYRRIKKFTAFAPAQIGDNFWVTTVPKDYKELSDIASNYFYTNFIIAGVIPLLLGLLLIYIGTLKKNLRHLEREQKYIEEVEVLNSELEKDIEERKVLEQALISSKERFKQLFNAGSDLIFVLFVNDDDRKFEINRVNNIACERLGLERKEIVGMDFRSIVSDITEDALETFMSQVDSGDENIYETQLHMSGGDIVPVEIAAQIFTLEGQKMMMLMTRDISKKKEEEAQLEKNRALLIYKFRLVAMGEMIANIAHQWRQPLGRLSLMISNLQDAYIHDDLEEDYFDEMVLKSQGIIQDMSAIIDEFRFFFNPINEKAYFNPEEQILSSIEMVKDRIQIDEVSVEVVNTAHHDIYGYPNQFSQVILNILNNSLDAMKDMSTERKILVAIDWMLPSDIRITIRNNGEALPAGMENQVFDPYFSTKKSKDGTGIGLYMTKMIIETNFAGTIEMRNIKEFVMTEIKIPIEEVIGHGQ